MNSLVIFLVFFHIRSIVAPTPIIPHHHKHTQYDKEFKTMFPQGSSWRAMHMKGNTKFLTTLCVRMNKLPTTFFQSLPDQAVRYQQVSGHDEEEVETLSNSSSDKDEHQRPNELDASIGLTCVPTKLPLQKECGLPKVEISSDDDESIMTDALQCFCQRGPFHEYFWVVLKDMYEFYRCEQRTDTQGLIITEDSFVEIAMQPLCMDPLNCSVL